MNAKPPDYAAIPDRELDREVAKALFDWRFADESLYPVTRYSADLTAAIAVVEAMKARGLISFVLTWRSERIDWHCRMVVGRYICDEVADSAPRAVCLSAIAAAEMAAVFAAEMAQPGECRA